MPAVDKPYTIALIHEDAAFVDDLMDSLSEQPFRVVPLRSMEMAIEWLEKNRPDAVIILCPMSFGNAIWLAEDAEQRFNCNIAILGERTDSEWLVLPRTHPTWGMIPRPWNAHEILCLLNRWSATWLPEQFSGPSNNVVIEELRHPAKSQRLFGYLKKFSLLRYKEKRRRSFWVVVISIAAIVCFVLASIDTGLSEDTLWVLVPVSTTIYGFKRTEAGIAKDLNMLSRITGIVVFLAFCYGGFLGLDESGWIPHSQETTITARQEWLVGESKTCASISLEPEAAKATNRPPYDVTHYVECDDGPTHQIKVTFWGRTERQDKRARENGVRWKCIRKADSFSCLALD